MRRILILEDHPEEQEEITTLINTIDTPTELICCADTREAYVCALEGNVDLFIIDVILNPEQQEDTSGLKFVESIRGVTRYEFTPVIILTCLEDLRSYSYEKLHCYAYIEKPFVAEHLRKIIAECLRCPRLPERERTLYYRKDGAIVVVQREDVVYAKSVRHALHIYTRKKDNITIPYLTVKQFLIDADSHDFIQCSRNTVVNRKYVASVDLPRRRIFIAGEENPIEIGGTYVSSIRENFGSRENG